MANCYIPRLTFHILKGPPHFVWAVDVFPATMNTGSLGLLVSGGQKCHLSVPAVGLGDRSHEEPQAN
jgi:hypothetical protein